MRRLLISALLALAALAAALFFLTYAKKPERFAYGVTFSTLYAQELELDWKALYRAMFDDLQVKRVRVPAYWPMVEPERGKYQWSELDFEIREAEAHGASVILAVGRRLPRWPECHVPGWARSRPWDEQKGALREYITAVVERYKDSDAVEVWQVENEPYLSVFASDQCGPLDESFLGEEIALVHALDSRPILVTDSGNLGTWAGAYRHSDIFGTSIYLYFWNQTFGAFRTVLPPAYYRGKENIMSLIFGKRRVIVSELSLEPWLGASINDVPIATQLERMDIEKWREIIAYASETRIAEQYLWGVEWWYYMKEKQNHPEFWAAARLLFEGEQ